MLIKSVSPSSKKWESGSGGSRGLRHAHFDQIPHLNQYFSFVDLFEIQPRSNKDECSRV